MPNKAASVISYLISCNMTSTWFYIFLFFITCFILFYIIWYHIVIVLNLLFICGFFS